MYQYIFEKNHNFNFNTDNFIFYNLLPKDNINFIMNYFFLNNDNNIIISFLADLQ